MATDPAASTRALVKRLRWRCRRGTRELDALLGDWLDRHSADSNPSALRAFDALLDQQDPDVWNWLMGHAAAPRADWQAILSEIRGHAGLAP
ncbi:MAG TPA: succinate dehydrogenase assembly factor 2 [Rhodanobacteraceae bacterium]|jgi:antitoxin CptB|nr:succinate dehydrogenase assembly factor 2 [Rhodanobacteraceae bacterium]